MTRYVILVAYLTCVCALNLDYLDPTKLQTKTPASIQQQAALAIISKYSDQVTVEVNPILFKDNKDVFSLRTTQGQLRIRASTGVAAVWGFNYYLKKYCKSQIAWQNQRVSMPNPLPDVDEVVVASDRFRYYQNVCTASYSFVWWNGEDWNNHIEWMALSGINLALAPVAQEAAWARVYRQLGMTKDEIDQHFTGPAFLAWLRMGNLRGWGGPLLQSWHDRQKDIQDGVIDYMFRLGIVPVFPAFNGHAPRAFSRIFPNVTLHAVEKWNKFGDSFCCDYFVDPNDPVFKMVGKMFLKEVTAGTAADHIYAADPFNEISVGGWSTKLVADTAKAIFDTLYQSDDNAVWLVQNWMFAHDPLLWPKDRVKAFLTAVPNGRMLVLDLQSEQWPQYNLYEMYYGQPFIWCMLHNFGGTLGMFGSVQTINSVVYEVRERVNTTMIGIGLTPEGINQNYVVYDLMLETGWRKKPIQDLDTWVAEYAERRYGCNDTSDAWKLLLRSVYNFEGLNKMRGKYVITRRPSLKIKPWAWYKSKDLFDALQKFVFTVNENCFCDGFHHDLVDITRQALQYRAEQLYLNIVDNRFSNTWVFNETINQFLDVMRDMEAILATHPNFGLTDWLSKARKIGASDEEGFFYELNARNQITLWGPNGEITDYACKQWAEVFFYYYIPRWSLFLSAAVDAKVRNEIFDERGTQRIVRATVEKQFAYIEINPSSRRFSENPRDTARALFEKWAYAPDLEDLPLNVIPRESPQKTTMADVDEEYSRSAENPTVTLLRSTTPDMK